MPRSTFILGLSLAIITQVSTTTAQSTKSLPCPCQMNQVWTIIPVGDSFYIAADSIQPPFKSPSTAFKYSLWGTIAPLPTLVLTLPAIIVGPSLGYFYGGKPGRAWLGIGLRTAGLGGMVSSFAICGWDCGPGDSGYDIAWVVFLAGGGLTVVSAIVDIASVKRDIRERNEKLSTKTQLSAGPMYFPMTKTVGVGISLRF